MRKLLVFLFLFTTIYTASAQRSSVNWLNTEQLEEKYYLEPKPILIFLETSWCKICKMQLNTTFANDSVVKKVNDNFYAFTLNAENKDSLSFFNRSYRFNTAEKFHDLALYFGKHNNRMEFPTTVILDEKLQLLFRKAALVNSVEMLELLEGVE